MPRRPIWVLALLLVAVAAIAVAACGGPVPTATTSTTPVATQTTRPAPTTRPTPTLVPGETSGPAAILSLAAKDIAFDRLALDVRAGSAFVIRFRNEDDATIPHVVDLRRLDGRAVVQDQEPIMGGEAADYAYAPLPAGDYLFMCSVHPIPGMTGTLRVR